VQCSPGTAQHGSVLACVGSVDERQAELTISCEYSSISIEEEDNRVAYVHLVVNMHTYKVRQQGAIVFSLISCSPKVILQMYMVDSLVTQNQGLALTCMICRKTTNCLPVYRYIRISADGVHHRVGVV